MADIIKDSYDESNRFTKVVFQRAKTVVDFELNELQDNLRVQQYRAIQKLIETWSPGSNDDGYLVTGTGAANEVTIEAGTLFCEGLPITNEASFSFSGFTTYGGGGTRTDTVYLAISEAEVPDPEQVPKLGETSVRKQLLVVPGVAEGVAPPANTSEDIWEGGTHYFPIATVERASGVATIDPGDVTDLRSVLPNKLLDQQGADGQFLGRASGSPAWLNLSHGDIEEVTIDAALVAGNNNNFAPTGWQDASFIRLSAPAFGARLTGIDITGVTVKRKVIANVGSFTFELYHADGSSDFENQILINTSEDTAIRPNEAVEFVYDDTSSRWRIASVTRNTSVISVTSTGTVTNFAPTGWQDADVLMFRNASALTIEGFLGSSPRQPRRLINVLGNDVILKHLTGASFSQMICPDAQDYPIGPGESVTIYRDDTQSKWLVVPSLGLTADNIWRGSNQFRDTINVSDSAGAPLVRRTLLSLSPANFVARNILGEAYFGENSTASWVHIGGVGSYPRSDSDYWTTSAADRELVGEISLPLNADIKAVQVAYSLTGDIPAGVGNGIRVTLEKVDNDGTGPTYARSVTSSQGFVHGADGVGSLGSNVVQLNESTPSVASESSPLVAGQNIVAPADVRYRVNIKSPTDLGGFSVEVRWVEVRWDEAEVQMNRQ